MSGTWLAHAGLLTVQLSYAGYHVLTKIAMTSGLDQIVFCVYRDLIAWSILAPTAYISEKRSRPPLTRRFLFMFFILGLTGIYLNQLLFTIGLKLTSPAFAAALQPAVPVYTTVLAVLMGSEQLHWRRADGKAKVAGVLVTVLGAMILTFYKGPPVIGDGYDLNNVGYMGAVSGKPSPEPLGLFGSAMVAIGLDSWHLGAACLIGNSISLAVYFAIQKPFLATYPQGSSVTAYSYTFGLIFMLITLLITTRDAGALTLNGPEIYSVLYGGCIASAYNYLVMTACNKALGPALVALYIPLQPLFSAILATLFLGTSIFLGSIIGGILIMLGLYIVTWSRKESERLGSLHRRHMSFSEARGESSISIRDPLLKVLGQRVVSHHSGPSSSLSELWKNSP